MRRTKGCWCAGGWCRSGRTARRQSSPPSTRASRGSTPRLPSAGAWERGRRCILPAAGFYEWQRRGAGKQPFFIKLQDREIFGFAGLWELSKGPDGWLESCTIITLPANRLLSEIHNGGLRMPAILREEDHEAWLAGTLDDARRALQPYPDERMFAWPVSPRVNTAKNDDEALTHPVDPPDGAAPVEGRLL